MPLAEFKQIPETVYIKDKDEAWYHVDNLVTNFVNLKLESSKGGGTIFCFFFLEKRAKGDLHFFWGINPTDHRWDEAKQKISYTNKIYDNSQTAMYAP